MVLVLVLATKHEHIEVEMPVENNINTENNIMHTDINPSTFFVL